MTFFIPPTTILQMSSHPTILFLPSQSQVEIKDHHSVLAVALSGEIDLGHSCGGMGTCGTCRIFLKNPKLNAPPRNDLEQEMAETRGFTDAERLACQLTPQSDMVVEVPPQRRT